MHYQKFKKKKCLPVVLNKYPNFPLDVGMHAGAFALKEFYEHFQVTFVLSMVSSFSFLAQVCKVYLDHFKQ